MDHFLPNLSNPLLITDNRSPIQSTPLVTVGVRFHDIKRTFLLERCLLSISTQRDVRVHVHIVTQGFQKNEILKVVKLATDIFFEPEFSFEVDNVANPKKVDLRAHCLNRIVNRHYEAQRSEFLCFIDYDDIWFSHALKTLIEPLCVTKFSVSYADVRCGDVYYDNDQVYLRKIVDFFDISRKTKRDLLVGNFLPLHSYMFHTGLIRKEDLTYDETLARLEDYDVLLTLARMYAFTAQKRRTVIGLYNFYETMAAAVNTTANPFSRDGLSGHDDIWKQANKSIRTRHAGLPWTDFVGEQWELE